VISAHYRSDLKIPLPVSGPDRPRLHLSDLLLPAAIALWALGVSRAQTAALGPYGLPAALPVVFYAGVALLIVSAGIELARDQLAQWRMSLHAITLVVMLFGTAPLVYSQGRYAWLYKTIGVVQYVNAHGQLNRYIDIYQNWPGFFAVAAWFGKVAGVGSPLAYAKWAQLVFELAALPLIYLIYDALSLSTAQRWVAVLLYSAGNWIGQDYFSPQALGTLLYLGIMALALRWLYVDNAPNPHKRARARRVDHAHQLALPQSLPYARRPALLCLVIALLYFVLTFTHELTPYMLAIQLAALAIARLLRPAWLPFVLAGIAVAYLMPRFAFVNSKYGLLDSIGNFFRNAALPSTRVGTSAVSGELFNERCAEALSVGMWGLALAGAWLRRRSGHTVFALTLLTFSPIILLGVQAYGDEGILRTYLFSLPWAAALAASALVAWPASLTRPGAHRATVAAAGASSPRHRPGLSLLRAPLAVGIAVALFLPAFFGDDSFNAMPATEVATLTSFFESARPGPVYCAVDNASVADTARYNLFPLLAIFGSTGVAGPGAVKPDIADVLANEALRYTNDSEPAYILVAPSMIAFSQAYRLTPSRNFITLLTALAHSRAWKLVVNRAGAVVYELPPNVSPSEFGQG